MKLNKIVTKDDSINRMQASVATILDFIQLSPLVGSVSTVETTFSGTTEKQVEHKLGRNPIGWIVVSKDAPSDIYSTGSESNILKSFKATASVTCKILFF